MEEARYNELASKYDASTLTANEAVELRGELITRLTVDTLDKRGVSMLSGMAGRVAAKVEAARAATTLAATRAAILTPELLGLLTSAVQAAHAAGYAGVIAKWDAKVIKDDQGKDVDQSGPVIDLLGVKASPATKVREYIYGDLKDAEALKNSGDWKSPHDIVWIAARVLDQPDGKNSYIQNWGAYKADPRYKFSSGKVNKWFEHLSHWESAHRVVAALGADHPALAPYRVAKPVVEVAKVTSSEVAPPDA